MQEEATGPKRAGESRDGQHLDAVQPAGLDQEAQPGPPKATAASSGGQPPAQAQEPGGAASGGASGRTSGMDSQEQDVSISSEATASSSNPELRPGRRGSETTDTSPAAAGGERRSQPVQLPPPPPQQQQQGAVPAQGAAAAEVQDLGAIPVLPDILRSKESKRDLPLICHIEGCGEDLQGQAEYYQRYRICKAHLKASALLVDGVPQRFCQQCGRFQNLSEFDGEKRNCRARLEQHNSRRRKVFVVGQGGRRGRGGRERAVQRGAAGYNDWGEGEEEGEDDAGLTDDQLPPYLRSRDPHVKNLSGQRRDRGTMEGDSELMKLTVQERETILLLRSKQQPQQAQRQALPRFMSEPVRGVKGGWQDAEGAVRLEAAGGMPRDETMLHPQGILGQQQYLSRQEQLAAAGLEAVSGGRQGGAYSAASAQPSLQHSSRSQLLQGFPSATSARDDARLADLLAVGAAAQRVPTNPFAPAAAGGFMDRAGAGPGGVFRTLTEPMPAARGAELGGGVARPRAAVAGQMLAPTVPRDGLSSGQPRSAADLLRTLQAVAAGQTAAAAQQQQQQQQQQHAQQGLANPFLQQRSAPAPALPPSQPTNLLPGLAGLLGALFGGGGAGMPKTSTLLRQMADLAAVAEMQAEQAALQQAAQEARPMADVLQRASLEDLLRRVQQAQGGASAAAAAAPPPPQPQQRVVHNPFAAAAAAAAPALPRGGLHGMGGSSSSSSGTARGVSARDLLAALGLPQALPPAASQPAPPAPPASSFQQEQQERPQEGQAEGQEAEAEQHQQLGQPAGPSSLQGSVFVQQQQQQQQAAAAGQQGRRDTPPPGAKGAEALIAALVAVASGAAVEPSPQQQPQQQQQPQPYQRTGDSPPSALVRDLLSLIQRTTGQQPQQEQARTGDGM